MSVPGRDVLQLGAGEQRLTARPGDRVVRVDVRPTVQPDVVWDLDRFRFPFPDDSFDVIDCTDALEHLDDLVKVTEEIHRVARPGDRFHTATPHFSCANSFNDPTRLPHLGLFSFDYFTGEGKYGSYSQARFAKRRFELFFSPGAREPGRPTGCASLARNL